MKNFHLAVALLLIAPLKADSCKGPECNGLVVDCDPGGDDAMALALLIMAERRGLVDPSKSIHSITTVSGNTGAANATRNTKVILETMNACQIPIYQGSENALAKIKTVTFFYGYDGFGDFLPSPPPVDKTALVTAATHLATVVKNNPGKMTIVCIGPLTNLALAYHMYPNFLNDVKHIYILGGSHMGGGNMDTLPGVEANMYSDPDAAAFFFESLKGPEKVTLVPLETVHLLNLSMDFRNNVLGRAKNKIMNLLNKAERKALETFAQRPGSKWDCYDQLTAGIIIRPEIITATQLARIFVITEGHRGFMVADKSSNRPNARVVTGVNRNAMQRLLVDLLTRKDDQLSNCKIPDVK